ncbi:MAG: tetratricopeptide repeat protein, partial [Candidatus Aminicenantes bacterium]|nr:tetratricopeptide repeat protein [Candidatus Aminicenantes bacterium]
MSYAKFSYKRLKDYEKANELFNKARRLEEKLNKPNIKGLNAQAEFFLDWGRHEKEAGDIINRIIRETENKLLNIHLAARFFQELGMRNTAVLFFEASLRLQPNHVPTLNSYANACVQWGDRERAKELFEKSLSIDPEHVPTLNSYANASVQWGDSDRAKELFEKALEIDSQNIQVLNSYADASVQWGDRKRAEELLKKSLSIDPEHVPTLNIYANACVQWGERDRAEKLFEEALEIDSNNIQVLNSYAYACVQWGEKDRAKELFEKALEIDSQNIQVLNSYAYASVQWGERERAEELFEKALEIDSQNIQVLNSYANACVQWGERDVAEELFEKAFKINPHDVMLLNSYANACVQWGDKERAEELFKKEKEAQAVKQPRVRQIKEEIKKPAAVEPAPIKKTAVPTIKEKKEPAVFFTAEEQAWLADYNGEILAWAGDKESRRWAAFTMLYSLSYFKSDLAAAADLGYLPSLERENKALYNRVKDLYDMLEKASFPGSTTSSSYTPLSRQDEWFKQEGKGLETIAYFDSQLLSYPQNPVCAAFLCQAFAAASWDNIAAEIALNTMQWLKPDETKWQDFFDRSKIDLLSPAGKENFLSFLQEQDSRKKTGSIPEGVVPMTADRAAGYIGRFSVAWEETLRCFPWYDLTPGEESRALTKLFRLVERLQAILHGLTEKEAA